MIALQLDFDFAQSPLREHGERMSYQKACNFLLRIRSIVRKSFTRLAWFDTLIAKAISTHHDRA